MNFIKTNQINPNLNYMEGVQINGYPARVLWEGEIWHVETRQGRNTPASNYIHGTFECYFFAQREKRNITLSRIEMAWRDNGAFYNKSDLSCNCHGFSLLDASYWLDDPTIIFEDECIPAVTIDEVVENIDYIVSWHDGKLYTHSGIYKNGMVLHKQNVRLVRHELLEDINVQYPNHSMQFWRRFE